MDFSKAAWWQWESTQKLRAAFERADAPLWFVGGAVRDALLEHAVTDVDATTSLHPDAVIALLKEAGFEVKPTGLKHGTVTAIIDHQPFEITTLRRDTACDGRHAEVEYTTDWREDAKRRDFTMNALYVTMAGELLDDVQGEADARAGVVQFIGAPADRIREDGLRMLRLFRFYAHYGKAPLAPEALEACRAHAGMILGLSGERIANEILKLLSAKNPWPTARLMQQAELLAPLLLPAAPAAEKCLDLPPMSVHANLAFWLCQEKEAALAHLENIRTRWRLSRKDADTLKILIVLQAGFEQGPMPALKEVIRNHGKTLANHAWSLFAALRGARLKHLVLDGFAMIEEWEAPVFPLRGQDILDAGIASGAAVGKVLAQLEATWVQSEYGLSKEELLAHERD